MNKIPSVDIYLLSRNRPHYVEQSIKSILSQTFTNYRCIISDNSTNPDIYELYLKSYINNDKVVYRKRGGYFSGIEHINLVHDEVEADYYIIFHDDDIMYSDMVASLYNKIKETNAIAVSCNAFLLRNGEETKKLFFNTSINHCLNTPMEIAVQYIKKEIMPFPSYIYNKKLIGDLRLDVEKGGKYCDSSFICSLANKGSVIFMHEPLMGYNIHSGQDSASHDFSMYLKLIKYYKSLNVNKKLLSKERIYNIYSELVRKYKNENVPYHFRFMLLISKYSKIYGIKYFIRYIMMYIKCINK